jgi:hypothetical protein
VSTIGLRKAAATLACLHPDDRAWLLEKLRPSSRYDLRRLVEQLQSMKIADSDIARKAVHICEEDRSLQPPPPDRLLAGMNGLSPVWCARVLAACASDHMEVFAANSSPATAGAVRAELLALPHLPPKLSETLARIVNERGARETSALKETQ